MFMMLQKGMMKKNKKGFTLIELIVVIAIIAILAIVLIPRLAGFREIARRSNDETFAATVANAAAVYLAGKPNHANVATAAEQDALAAELASADLLDPALITMALINGRLQSDFYDTMTVGWDGTTVTVQLLDGLNVEYTITK